MRRVALLVTLISAAPVIALVAQDAAPTVGQRVRIKTTSSTEQWLVGTLAATGGDSLRLRLQGSDSVATIVVARSNVTSFEVSHGRHSNAGRGAMIGGAIFGTLGLIAGAQCASNQGWLSCSSGEAAVLTVLAALEGAGLGALIGSFSHSERWQRTPLSESRVSVAPYGAGVRVSIAF